MHHYLSMAKGNFREYLKRDKVKIKKYFYVLRPILACKWIEKNNTMPPMKFNELVYSMLSEDLLRDEIDRLLKRKIAGEEMDIEPKIEIINDFIQHEIDHLENYVKSISKKQDNNTEQLNHLYRETLKEV